MKYAPAALAVLTFTAAACAQDTTNVFADGPNGEKVHSPSGFVCPAVIGHFERDAVGERDPQAGSDFCAYSGRDGVYGTITLAPLPRSYDPKAMLASEFVVQEGVGGRMVDEATLTLGPKTSPLPVYSRTYETAKLESMHYKTVFTIAAIGSWAVEATVEYADPRDIDLKTDFVSAVYAGALAKIAAQPH